ncbi:hypothetical protein N658DRAFT_249132 [Parathielavia hyrcaniae]|uniref:Uncharacterized protein n=1 Tax=Parathielavia hyrcaniae TaxID=113614 RepID=A0AAN6Q7E6_9PEZI|nr:hypothetical protein N658DRAFT_249132 [Parathielavia hyrcaniae]
MPPLLPLPLPPPPPATRELVPVPPVPPVHIHHDPNGMAAAVAGDPRRHWPLACRWRSRRAGRYGRVGGYSPGDSRGGEVDVVWWGLVLQTSSWID